MAKLFEVRVKTSKGIESVKVHANTVAEAKKSVENKGRPISAKAKMGGMLGASLSRADRITLLRRLSMMVRSRVSITKSLHIISSSFSGKISETAKILEQKIMAGDELTDAMESMPADFPPSTVSLIRSGMHGGELHQALFDASEFEDEMYRIGKGAKSGMLSAFFEFIMASVLILVTAYWVAPWVMESDIMRSAGDAVNIDWAFWIAHVLAVLIILLLVTFISLFLIAYVFKPIAPTLSDDLTLKIPVFRDLVLSKTYYSVFYGLSLLISSGVRLKESLELAAENAPPGAIKDDLLRSVEELEKGGQWASKMAHLQQTDRACLETSQDREEIANAFMVVATFHRINYAKRIEQVVPALGFIANMFMAMAGFLIFAMTMLPNLQLTRGILQ